MRGKYYLTPYIVNWLFEQLYVKSFRINRLLAKQCSNKNSSFQGIFPPKLLKTKELKILRRLVSKIVRKMNKGDKMYGETEVIDALVGKEFKFYGAVERQFKLDNTVFQAIEDESDGYRSYLESIIRIDSEAIFFNQPIAVVRVEKNEMGDFEGFSLLDIEDNHEWLRVGTDITTDDYYPYFTFDYSPKAPK